jgi:hypothetical protein
MRLWNPEATKYLADAHVEILRGGPRRPIGRRVPRKN